MSIQTTGLGPQNIRKRPANWEEIPVYKEGVNLPVNYVPQVIEQRLVTPPRRAPVSRPVIDGGKVFAVTCVILIVALMTSLVVLAVKLLLLVTLDIMIRVASFVVFVLVLWSAFVVAKWFRGRPRHVPAPPRYDTPASRNVITNVTVKGGCGDVITNINVEERRVKQQ